MLKSTKLDQRENLDCAKWGLIVLVVELEVLISILREMEKSLDYDIQLYVLCFVLYQRARSHQLPEDWARNQDLFRRTLQLRPPCHRVTFTLLHNLGAVIVTRHKRLGNSVATADLNEDLPTLRRLLPLMAPNDPNLLDTATALARGVYWRHTLLNDQNDLESAIKYFELVMNIRPSSENVELSVAYHDLAMAHILRLGADCYPAVDNLRKCCRFLPRNHPFYPEAEKLLCDSLSLYISRSGDMTDVEEAIQLQWEVLKRHPVGDPSRSDLLTQYGDSCFMFYTHSQALSHLNLHIQHSTQFHTELQNCQSQERVDLLVSLVSTHHTRFTRSAMPQDLDVGMGYATELLELCPPGHPSRLDCLSVTWLIYRERYGRSGDFQGLQTALEHARSRLELLPPDDSNPVPLINLADLIVDLDQQRIITLPQINESIELSSKAVSLARSSNHPKLYNAIRTFGLALRARYQHTGNLSDLDKAIEYLREEKMMLKSKDTEMNALSLCRISTTLCLRYRVLRHDDDLEEASSCIKEAFSLGGETFFDRPDVLNSLVTLFQVDLNTPSLKRLKCLKDLTAGLTLLKKSLEMCSATSPSRHMYLSNTAWSLLHRFQRTCDPEDAQDAVAYLREAIELSAQPQYMYILACTLLQRATILRSISDLEEAIATFHRAEKCASEHHPIQGYIAHGLADAFALRNRATDIQESFSYLEKAANHLSGALLDRLMVAGYWASKARLKGHKSAIRAFSVAISLAEQLVMTSHNMETQYQRLTMVEESLPSQAACCAINEGELEIAVELLEQGRALLWSQVGRYRSSLDQLSSVNPSLAEEFRQLSHQLDRFVVTPTTLSDRDDSMYRLQSRRWNEMVERIRAEEGLHDFLKSIPFATLRQAAAKGPVIVINIGKTSDALIIQDTRSPTLVKLPLATPDAITSLARELTTALTLEDEEASKTKTAKITRIMRCLWEFIASPIVGVLIGSCGLYEGSRIWWCPTSALWSLPLHAAGPYRAGEKNLPDIFVSSYTPTLSALLRSVSRKPRQSEGASPSMLVVGQVQTPGQVSLVNVVEEMRQVQEMAPSVTFLDGEDCVCEAVLSGLHDCSWVHFACHGKQDLVRPFDSHFILQDKPLHLLEIIKTGLPNAEFAFLSACHSAAGDQRTPDESIHLASGLQFAGFKSVVGTMWEMADEDGPVIAKEFYKYMFRNPGVADCEDAAVALNRATRALRRMKVPVYRWINFVHIGA